MHKFITTMVTAAVLAACVASANAGAIIQNSEVQLGVNSYGSLIVPGGTQSAGYTGYGSTDVGLRSVQTNVDAVAPDWQGEGWGVGIRSTGIFGKSYKDQGGATNLALQSFTSTASTANSVVNVLAADGSTALQVTQDFRPVAATPYLYEVLVTITNLTGSALAAGDLVYRRLMDWDVPTPGAEAVTIQGVPTKLGLANGSNLTYVSTNGFSNANPLAGDSNIADSILPNQNMTDVLGDNGAMFDFEFGALADNASQTFSIYYGWAPDKATADLARSMVNGDASDVDVGLYSYGVCGDAALGCDVAAGTPDTFIFGFGTSDGMLVPPSDPNAVPEPASLALMGMGLVAAIGVSRRRKALAAAAQATVLAG